MFAQYIYDKSPYIMQSQLFKYHCGKLHRRRYGKKFEQAVSHLEKTQWYSYGELIEYQDEKLKNIVEHAYNTVSYYHEVMKDKKLKPKDITKVDHIYKLPILTNEIVRRNKNKLISNKFSVRELMPGHTSGTTGTPLEFYWDKNLWFWNNVFHWRQKNWSGISFGDPYALFLGRTIVSINKKEPPFWQYNPYENQLWVSSFHLNPKKLPAIVNKILEFNPKAIEGYPSTLSIFASLLKDYNKNLYLKASFTSSETLYDNQKLIMEDIFNCNNYDFYGLAERVIWGTECSMHNGKHLNMEYGITEVVDEKNNILPNGKTGYLVGTRSSKLRNAIY